MKYLGEIRLNFRVKSDCWCNVANHTEGLPVPAISQPPLEPSPHIRLHPPSPVPFSNSPSPTPPPLPKLHLASL